MLRNAIVRTILCSAEEVIFRLNFLFKIYPQNLSAKSTRNFYPQSIPAFSTRPFLGAVHIRWASLLCRLPGWPLLTGSCLTYSFDIILKLHSYRSEPARLGEMPPERSKISPLAGLCERIKQASLA